MSDIDTAAVDSLKALDPERPIREVDIHGSDCAQNPAGDVIGEWAPAYPVPRLPSGISTLQWGSKIWSGFFTWEHIPGWRWRMKTSKSKYRSAGEFDLTNYGLLYPLLEAVPHAQRVGSIVKDEGDLPVRQSSYGTRAGAAPEAEEAGAAIEDIRDALTHSEARTTARYIRRRTTKIAAVNAARQRSRANESGGTS